MRVRLAESRGATAQRPIAGTDAEVLSPLPYRSAASGTLSQRRGPGVPASEKQPENTGCNYQQGGAASSPSAPQQQLLQQQRPRLPRGWSTVTQWNWQSQRQSSEILLSHNSVGDILI